MKNKHTTNDIFTTILCNQKFIAMILNSICMQLIYIYITELNKYINIYITELNKIYYILQN